DKVLVNGASGGVGTFAVQLARAFGAEVTGVCGPRNVDMVRSIGAHQVIDYTERDFTRSGQRYDVLIDIAGSRPGWACRRVLTGKGALVAVGGEPGRWVQPGGHVVSLLAAGPFVSQRVSSVNVVTCEETKRNLVTLTGLIEDGKVTPVIDRSFPFARIPEAVTYQEAGHAAGKVVITVGG
ncbi:NAD(P)-dependent alcohol dehydrogenase, partial [Nonomuraea sp. K271]